LFEGLFGAATGGRRGSGGFGGFGRRQAPPQKGADVAYRLKVPFVDAAALKPQRVTLSGGKTVDLKLPNGVDSGTKIRLAGQGQQGAGGKGDAIVAIEVAPHAFFTRDGKDIRLTLPITLKEAVEGAKVKAPTPDGAVMLTVPKGSSSGKVLRLKGRGFTDKTGKRGDQLVTLSVELPSGDAALEKFVAGWEGAGNPRAGMGV
jgi:DnaJ-class molecular chaperone